MERLHYLDFDLKIERAGKRYAARVLHSPVGEASHSFTLPFSEEKLENLLLKIGGRRLGPIRRINSAELEAARELGGKLFEAVFGDEVRTCFGKSLDEASRQKETGIGLRLKLRLQEVPELADLPWEFLYDPRFNRFPAQSNQTPIVRYIELPARVTPLAINLPLRVLVVISSPTGDPRYPLLDVEREKSMLQKAFDPLIRREQVQVQWLAEATMPALQRCLRAGTFHVLHYIGHGGFDKQGGEGVLVLEDGQRHSQWAGAERLSVLLHDHRWLRLVVLNCCEGALNSPTDPFAGVATSLIRQGIPAVVAMQFEISDNAAITFSSEFYAALVQGFPVDAAVAEARKAIFFSSNDIEWGTPVLYMRSPDGVLFNMPEQRRQPEIEEEQKEQAFEFEVVTVNAKGREIKRTRGKAYQQIEDLGKGVILEMVYIPGGTFLMGSPENEEGRFDFEGPQHEVTVAPFYMGKYPVTQEQWEVVMGNNPSYFKGAKRPVENVSWDDVQEFLRKLNERVCSNRFSGQEERLKPSLQTEYRLPSEAEWEYACRAGTTTPFYFGETITTDLANYNGNYTYASGPKGEYRKQTTDVGSFQPNVFGLYDMHGNVWEWCADPWHNNYQGAPTDGSVWELSGGSRRVLRGGSWSDHPRLVRCAAQDDFSPSVRSYIIGFRLVRTK
jgi:formylglycine-generating enzyme required for sulfatase activity